MRTNVQDDEDAPAEVEFTASELHRETARALHLVRTGRVVNVVVGRFAELQARLVPPDGREAS
jgi:hypothetical protein